MKKILLLENDQHLIESIKRVSQKYRMLLAVRQFAKCAPILDYLGKCHTDVLLFNHDYLSKDLTEIIKIQRRFPLVRILIYYNPLEGQFDKIIAWDYSLFTYMGEFRLNDLFVSLQQPNGMYLLEVN